MSKIFEFQSAILSSLPFLCQYLSATIIGILADKAVTNYNVPIRRVRKVSVFICKFKSTYLAD